MKRPNHLWIDQYGQHVWARTLKELRLKCGGGRICKVYRDDPLTKRTTHCGYVVGSRWFSRYAPVERAL